MTISPGFASRPAPCRTARPSPSGPIPMDLPLIRPHPPRLSQLTAGLEAIEASGSFSNNGPVARRFEREATEILFGGRDAGAGGRAQARPDARLHLRRHRPCRVLGGAHPAAGGLRSR